LFEVKPPAPAYCAEYQAVYNAYPTKPGADTAAAQNTLVNTLVTTNAVWDSLDIFYCLANRTANDAKIEWTDPTGDDNITASGKGETFTVYEGYTGDGVAGTYLNTNWNPSTEGVNFSLNDASLGIYERLSINEDRYAIGNIVGSDYNGLRIQSGTVFYVIINGTGGNQRAVANGQGCFIGVRKNATTLSYYRNAVDLTDRAVNSTAIPNGVLYILAYKAATTGGVTNQISFAFAGGALSAAQITTLNTAIETYMDYLGKGVE
jgi:hypothetical protein